MGETLTAELSQLEIRVKEGYKELKSAETKLSLLGEVECQRLLREYGLSVSLYRREAISDRRISAADLQLDKTQLREKLEKFLAALSDTYTRT